MLQCRSKPLILSDRQRSTCGEILPGDQLVGRLTCQEVGRSAHSEISLLGDHPVGRSCQEINLSGDPVGRSPCGEINLWGDPVGRSTCGEILSGDQPIGRSACWALQFLRKQQFTSRWLHTVDSKHASRNPTHVAHANLLRDSSARFPQLHGVKKSYAWRT